jgi:hypothetical protein
MLAAVALGHGGGEVPEVVEVVGWGVAAQLVAASPAPGWRIAQPGDDRNVARFGQLHDLVVLGPGIDAGRVVAPVDEIALGVNLDVFPRELLADEAQAGGARQVENLGALGRLGFLLQEGVDAEGADGGEGQRRPGDGRRSQVGLGADGGVEPVDDAGRLPAQLLLARQVIERPGVGPEGEQHRPGRPGSQARGRPKAGWGCENS